jgi:hypothetical protein
MADAWGGGLTRWLLKKRVGVLVLYWVRQKRTKRKVATRRIRRWCILGLVGWGVAFAIVVQPSLVKGA